MRRDDTKAAPAPKHARLAAQLEERITSSMQPHDALPTERQLIKEFGVSRTTVRSAMQKLLARGLVYQVQGSGTYVADPGVISKTLRLTSFSEDMRERGMEPGSVILTSRVVSASPEVAAVLRVEAGEPLVFVRRLRLADREPMALESVYLLNRLVDPDRLDLSGSLYEQLDERGLHIERAEQNVGAVNLDAEQGKLLNQAVGAAAIRVMRVTFSDRGQAIERAETLYRADRYSFDIVVARG